VLIVAQQSFIEQCGESTEVQPDLVLTPSAASVWWPKTPMRETVSRFQITLLPSCHRAKVTVSMISVPSALMLHWFKFNVVGMLGFLVQSAVLLLLMHVTPQIGYLSATAAAVELAVLHNFVWHQRWTWRDRPSATIGETLFRLMKFNLSNGLFSIFGNLVFMSILVGGLRLPITGANVLSVLACSICNFILADRIAFDVHTAEIGRVMDPDPST